VRHDGVDHAHPVRVLRGVGLAEEEDLAGELLTHLAGEVGGAEPAVEAGHVRVGLLEARVLGRGDRQVRHDVQRVAAACRPPWHHADDDLGHEPDEPLALEDVQASEPGLVDRLDGLPLPRTGSRGGP
jgi:hypothetical protein